MSTANSLYTSFGGTALPTALADFSDTLTPLDPARDRLLALFASAINAELGEVWAKLFTGTALDVPPGNTAGLATTHPLYGSTPVQTALALEPSPHVLKQVKVGFPLLALHRTGTGVYEQHTLNEDRLTQPWSLHYILCPLDVGDERKFLDVCVAVAKIVRLVVRKRGHLSYQSGALQFFPGVGDLASVELKSHEGPGQARFAGDDTGPIYYAITLNLETVELSSDNVEGQSEPFDGVMYEVGVGGENEILPALIYADSAVPLP